MSVRKWVGGALVVAVVAGGSLVGATAVQADPPGAPNNTGTGQTAASNGTGNSGNSSYSGNSSDNDHDNNTSNSNTSTAQAAADTYNGGENGEGEFGGTDSVANAAANPSDYGNDDPQPPSQPTPGPVPDDLLAGDVIIFPLRPQTIIPGGTQIPGTTGAQGLYVDNMGNFFGNIQIMIPDIKPANSPTRKSFNCDFESGTTNLADTRSMFPDRCGVAWHPELHKCDYSSAGWRCYAL